MFSFKSYKRKCLIRLMTVLGFGGMVGFCIASCQSPKANQDQQTEQKSSDSGNSEQPEQLTETQADNPSPQNTETQDVQETIENTDTVQTEICVDEQIVLEQQIPDLVPNNTKRTNNGDNTQFITKPPLYGVRNPIGNPPTTPIGKVYRDEVRIFMIGLTKEIQSTCHPESGDLMVTFTIQKSGKIVHVKSTGGTLKGTEREVCIIKQIRNHRFREFEGSDIPVKHPFKF